MNIQSRIDEGHYIVERLLDKPPVHFIGPTMYEMPDESGIYAFSSRETRERLYAGLSKKGLRNRMKDHWGGITSSDLSKKLVVKGVVQDVNEGREWIRNNVDIRYMTSDDLSIDIRFAEHFLIGTLRPPFNR